MADGSRQSTHMVGKGAKIPSRKALLLFSGGLDSTTLLALLVAQGYEVRTLFFDYGQPARRAEHAAAEHNSEKYGATGHEALQLPSQLFKVQGTYWPARNLVLISAAAAYAESNHIPSLFTALVSIVLHPGFADEYPDCSCEFIESVNQSIGLGTKSNVVVQAPLYDVQKPGVLKLARALGVDPDDTISCLTPIKMQPCGACVSCRELELAKNW